MRYHYGNYYLPDIMTDSANDTCTPKHVFPHKTDSTGHKRKAYNPSGKRIHTAHDASCKNAAENIHPKHIQKQNAEHQIGGVDDDAQGKAPAGFSQPTENGTLYSLAELTDLWETCQDCGLFLFVDGARLGYGLMSEACDMTLPDLARRCDGFSIGGTKQGLLFGEALVLSHPALRRDFRYHIKQHGGLLAKGRLLGVQFCAILEDGLYFELARHADRLAMELRRAFETRGYEMLFDSYTNQQYPILPDGLLAQLEEEFALTVWSKVDGGHTAVRVCTSWATEPQAVQALIRALDRWEET